MKMCVQAVWCNTAARLLKKSLANAVPFYDSKLEIQVAWRPLYELMRKTCLPEEGMSYHPRCALIKQRQRLGGLYDCLALFFRCSSPPQSQTHGLFP